MSFMLNAQDVLIRKSDRQTVKGVLLGVSNGLSQGLINAVVLDQAGYLWIATKEGLNRYDGSGIKVYRHNPSDSLSLSDNLVTCLLVDEKNRLWVGTQSKGLNLFDRKTECFTHFRGGLPNSRSIPSDFISKLFLTPDGEVGVMSRANEEVCLIVSVIEESGEEAFSILDFCERYPVLADNDHCYNGLPNSLKDNNQEFSGFDNEGGFWFYDGYRSLTWYSPLALISVEQPVVFDSVVTGDRNEDELIKALVFNHDRSEVYLSDGHHKLQKFNRSLSSFEPFIELPDSLDFSGRIFVDPDGLVYSETGKNRVIKIDPVKRVVKGVNIPQGRMGVRVASSMTCDSFGNVWIPTNGYGLVKISSRQKLFHQLTFDQTQIRNIWLLRAERPHSRFTCDFSLVEKVMNQKKAIIESTKAEKMLQHLSSHLAIDDSENLIVSSRSKSDSRVHCVESFDPESGQKQTIYSELWTEDQVHSFSPVFFDDGGGIWFCNAYENQKIVLFNLARNDSVARKYRLPIHPGPLSYRFISDWHQDTDGKWWFATVKGLFSFDPKTEDWNHFQNVANDPSTLSFDVTLCICPDPKEPERFLWVGTEGRGLNKFDKKQQSFSHYTTDDGLPNDVIYGIQSDDHNNLWLSTNRGLSLFDPDMITFRNFSSSDGLNGDEFNRYQFSKSADGTMCFGGVEGTTCFHPNGFYKDTVTSSVIINGLKIANKPIEYTHQNGSNRPNYWLTEPIERARLLEFEHDVGMISLTFTMLDFTVPEQHQFRYKLNGLDKDWVDAGKMREATYTNLSPGQYTFQVMGLNCNNVWSEPSELTIVILPPWWGTWWFRTLLLLLVISLFYGFYRYRLAQVLNVERMRNRIAQDLHDEIGSTLSSISLFSEVLKKQEKNMSHKGMRLLEKISNSTSEMMESMNDIVWTIKSDYDRFEDVLNRMRAFAVNTTEGRGVDLKFQILGGAEHLNLSMDVRKNIYLIFKEAFNNAIKYSEADEIEVQAELHNRKLQLKVSDNGKGFDHEIVIEDRSLMGGNGLKGMKVRAAQINAKLAILSNEGRGTTLTLSVIV